MTPKLTNAEIRGRRREAALKAAATRRETRAQADRRAQAAEEKRRENLRAVIAEARRIRRESDLRYHAHLRRWSHHPREWTAAQIAEARSFLAKFIRTDGTPDPHPVRRKGRWRL
jgi:hypothetical protein